MYSLQHLQQVMNLKNKLMWDYHNDSSKPSQMTFSFQRPNAHSTIPSQFQEEVANEQTQNNQLVSELCSLLQSQQVRSNMGEVLTERVQKILSAAGTTFRFNKQNQENGSSCKKEKKRHVLGEINTFNDSNIQNNPDSSANKKKQISDFNDQLLSNCLGLQQNLAEKKALKQKMATKQNGNSKTGEKMAQNANFEKKKEQDLKLNKENKILHKQAKTAKNSHSKERTLSKNKPKIRITQMVIGNKTICKDNKETKYTQVSKSKQKTQKQIRNKSLKKIQSSCNLLKNRSDSVKSIQYSIKNVETVRQNHRDKKEIERKRRFNTCSSGEKHFRDENNFAFPKGIKSKKLFTEQNTDDSPNTYLDTHDAQELNQRCAYAKGSSSNSKFSSNQFLQKVSELQKERNLEEQSLEQKVKLLKWQINSEKYQLQCVKNSISMIKQQKIEADNCNNTIATKKLQNHKKLEAVWSEVKNLNEIIKDATRQNKEVLQNYQEEKNLTKMYGSVIEELKQQLKIEYESRDEIKKQLKVNKKYQQASKIRATFTREKNQVVLGNFRESLEKWII